MFLSLMVTVISLKNRRPFKYSLAAFHYTRMVFMYLYSCVRESDRINEWFPFRQVVDVQIILVILRKWSLQTSTYTLWWFIGELWNGLQIYQYLYKSNLIKSNISCINTFYNRLKLFELIIFQLLFLDIESKYISPILLQNSLKSALWWWKLTPS